MVNLIPSNSADILHLTLLQMLQEHDENQNSIDHLQRTLQLENAGNSPHFNTLQDINDKLKETEYEILGLQTTIEKVKAALKCSSCSEITPFPIVSGICGHHICQECQDKKLLGIFEAATKDAVPSKLAEDVFIRTLCPIPNCNKPTLGYTIPVRPLQTIASLLESKGLLPIQPEKPKTSLNIAQKQKAQYWLSSYYSRAILGSTSAVSVLDKVPTNKWSECVAIRLDYVSTIFAEIFKKAFLRQTVGIDWTIDYDQNKRVFLIQKTPEQTNALAFPMLNKSIFVIDVLEDGSLNMEQKSLPVSESKIPHFPYLKFSSIPLDYYNEYQIKKLRFTLHSNARLSALKKMGKVDEETLTWRTSPIKGVKVIYRTGVFSEPTVALATNYLSNIFSPSDNELYSGFGLELVAEGLQKEVGTNLDTIANSFLCHLIYAVSQIVEKKGVEIRKGLEQHGYLVLPVKISVPHLYADAQGKSYAIIGVNNPTIQEHFIFEQKKILLATVRLLTFDEVKILENVARTKGKIPHDAVSQSHLSSLIPREADLKENKATQSQRFQTAFGEFSIKKAKEYTESIDSIRKELVQQMALSPSQPLLPLIDENYKPPIDVSPQFEKFAEPSDLKDALQALYQFKVNNDRDDFLQRIAKHILSLFSEHSTLAYYLNFEAYLKNPHLYRASALNTPSIRSSTKVLTVFDFMESGKKLISHLMQRFEWAIAHQKKEKKAFNLEFCLAVVAADEKWFEESVKLLSKSVLYIGKLGENNFQKLKKFKLLSLKNNRGLHSRLVLQEIQNAGFQVSSVLWNQDTCICNICKVTVMEWRPWNTPWKMHDFTKHTDNFRALAKEGKA